MRLSTRSTYGMRALVELVLAAGHGPVSAAFIAKRQDLSVAYLEQLLHRLKKTGLVSSVRGPRGGYVLARTPRQITVGEIVGILEGNSKTRPERGRGAHRHSASNGKTSAASRTEAKDAHRHAKRIAQTVWRYVHERLAQSLDAVTLQDLCDEVRIETGEPLDHRYVFHI